MMRRATNGETINLQELERRGGEFVHHLLREGAGETLREIRLARRKGALKKASAREQVQRYQVEDICHPTRRIRGHK